jgi:serine carboxypeptidase-like clade 2
MLFVESPAGVGFSYSNTTADYTVGDNRTAVDMYKFLVGFTAAFPQYAGRELWITGESYGGHYVPMAVAAIVQGNAAGGNPKLNIKGFQVGNAWTDAGIDNTGCVNFWYGHNMIGM